MDTIVFVGDDEDDEDLELVFKQLRLKNICGFRKHPASFSFLTSPKGGVEILCDGEAFKPDLVIGWVFEEWLLPGAQILNAFKRKGIRVLNTAETLTAGQNKFSMSIALSADAIPHGSVICTFSEAPLKGFFDDNNHCPVVVKPAFVNCGGLTVCTSGKGVTRINSHEEARSQLVTLQNFGQPLYAQTYQERPRNSDIRVWLFGDGEFEAVRKVPQGEEWITNTSRGGTLEIYTPSDQCLDICRRAAKSIGAQIAGIDIAEAGQGYVVFEVNTCPTFLPAVPLLGEAVPQKWAMFLEKVLRDPLWALT